MQDTAPIELEAASGSPGGPDEPDDDPDARDDPSRMSSGNPTVGADVNQGDRDAVDEPRGAVDPQLPLPPVAEELGDDHHGTAAASGFARRRARSRMLTIRESTPVVPAPTIPSTPGSQGTDSRMPGLSRIECSWPGNRPPVTVVVARTSPRREYLMRIATWSAVAVTALFVR